MTDATPDDPARPKPLRLWPGVTAYCPETGPTDAEGRGSWCEPFYAAAPLPEADQASVACGSRAIQIHG